MRFFAIGLITACLAATAAHATNDADKARALLEEVGKAYRSAPTLTDTLSLNLDGEQSIIRLRFDTDNKRVQFDLPGYAVMAIDGHLMITSDAVPGKYMKTELKGTVTETLVDVFGSPESVPFHFVMRENRGVDAYLNSMAIGLLQDPTIAGFTPADSDDNDHHVISLSDSHGDSFVHVDPKTKLIRKIRVEVPPIPGITAERVVAIITMNPVLADELSEKIAFEPGDRTMVDSADQLVPQMIAAGDTAPEFTLPTLSGEMVSLSDLRGNIVVLDFWATWCVPCIAALPEVEEVAEWVQEQGHPVKVYAVNVWEHRGNTLEERTQIAGELWKDRGFKLENLMDHDDSYIGQLVITSIPTTVIIDGEGKVFKVHVGLPIGETVFDHLKHAITSALERSTD